MKKLCVLLAICLVLSSCFFAIPAAAASADFEVQEGVLVKYKGADKNVTLPGGVTAVGASAFEGNTTLQSVDLGSAVYSVGDRAFYGCIALNSVSGGENVSEVGDLAFQRTPYLDHSTAKYFMLGHVLLWYNGTSDSVTVPLHCTQIASYAFMKCDYLTSFTAYEGLIRLGTGAFYGCSKLTTVNLPATLSTVGAYALEGTPFLKSLGEFAAVGDKVLVKYQGTSPEVTIPDGVRRIAPFAFTSAKLTRVSLPESVYAVDAYAFADTVGLAAVELNEGLVTIGDGAFRGCKALTSLKTPKTLSYIGQYAFRGAGLTGAVLHGDYLTLSYHAFDGCSSLRYVLLSDDVQAVYERAFDGCTALEGISVPPALENIASDTFANCPKVTVCCEENSRSQSKLSSYQINNVMGDADYDGVLTITDATAIQFYAAELMELDGVQTASADIDFNAEIDVIDAMTIQLKVAELI